jgi:peptidoglycan/xylan/chitin deacetylase (PgdA/CDA1 family)
MMPGFFRDQARRLLGICLRPIYAGTGCIVVLHRVLPRAERSALAENRALEIAVEDLRLLLEWVRAAKLDPVALDAVPERLARPQGRKFIAFTLDDGYRDNLTQALPLFREFGVPFTVNVTTGLVARTASVWWYFLERLLAGRSVVRFSWDNQTQVWPCATPQERDESFAGLAALIRAQRPATRDALLRALGEGSGLDPLGDARQIILTWDEVRQLAAEPLATIGAHTAGHYNLNRLHEAEVRAEMLGAREEIETQLGRPVRHFAYPFGGCSAVNEREFRLAAECGFTTMMTTRIANLFPEHAELLDRLPRLVVSGNYPIISSLGALESGFTTVLRGDYRRVVTL